MILPLVKWTERHVVVKRIIGAELALIQPYSEQSDEKVALDLHVGNAVKYPNDENSRPIDGELKIRRNECLRIETAEEIHLPNNVFGIISCRSSMSARGLWVANAKIDPGFGDYLSVTVMNSTARTIILRRDEAFCSIYLSELEHPVDGQRRGPRSEPRRRGFAYWLEPHLPYIITAIASILASIAGSYFLVHWEHKAENSKAGNNTSQSSMVNQSPQAGTNSVSHSQ